MTSGFDPFDRLVVERTPAWIEELRDYCRIPCETAQLLEEFATVPGGPHDR